MSSESVVLINARTCGIYKSGGARYKTDPRTGERTNEVDNELDDLVNAYLAGRSLPAIRRVELDTVWERRVLVPTYYDTRHDDMFEAIKADLGWGETTLGTLVDEGFVSIRGGHGSPGNDQRNGNIPYIKVSDIRGLRVNVNPTNLVSSGVAQSYWRGTTSGLDAFDLVTPNRASNNIGEFAIFLPGEEQVVLTKEVFVLRVIRKAGSVWDSFSLLWALCLRGCREQWRRIALMQTNREDCGDRYREVRIPLPPSRAEATAASRAFRDYFGTVAAAKETFINSVGKNPDRYIASVFSSVPTEPVAESDEDKG
jgi:hypothetical protein